MTRHVDDCTVSITKISFDSPICTVSITVAIRIVELLSLWIIAADMVRRKGPWLPLPLFSLAFFGFS